MPYDILRGKYEILKEIGRGGMSRVFLCMDINLNKQWALKMIQKGRGSEGALREAYLMRDLDHPALPRIVDIFEDESHIYYVMDYVDGTPLSRILEYEGPIPERRVIGWGRKLADALIYLHSRNPAIIHRDLKPANIMLTSEGNIKLIDFGIAREYKEENLKDTTYLGTKGYAAPEQFKGVGQTDARTDIYSLGVTLYTLLTGKNPAKPPYEIYPIRTWNPALSRGLESIVSKCTRQDPDERYESAQSLMYALCHIREEDPVYILKQKKRLAMFKGAVCLVIMGAFLLFGGQMLRVRAIDGDYDNHIHLAKTATNKNDREDHLLRAIELRPGDINAYTALVESFKEDAGFDEEEEKTLIRSVNEHMTELKANGVYGKLAYDIGKLYWYYFEEGGIRSSIGWFEEAMSFMPEGVSEHNTANIYANIAKFNRDIILNIEEGADMGLYGEYFNNLISLVDMSESETNEMIRIRSASLVLSAFELYRKRYKQDGITGTQAMNLFERAKMLLENTEAVTERTSQMKSSLEDRIDLIQTGIENAFSEEG